MGNLGYRRDVLYFQSQGARRFGIDGFSVWLEEIYDAGTYCRVVERYLDSQAVTHLLTKCPYRGIHVVGNQEVIPSSHHGQYGSRTCGET
ncbi:hypothetical protein D3C85_1210090 [compost metagenome]